MTQHMSSRDELKPEDNDKKDEDISTKFFRWGILFFSLCLVLWDLNASDLRTKVTMWLAFGTSGACLALSLGLQLRFLSGLKQKLEKDRSWVEWLSPLTGTAFWLVFIFGFMTKASSRGGDMTFNSIFWLFMAWILCFWLFTFAPESESPDKSRKKWFKRFRWLIAIALALAVCGIVCLCLRHFVQGIGLMVMGITAVLGMIFITRPRNLPF